MPEMYGLGQDGRHDSERLLDMPGQKGLHQLWW